MGRLTEGTETTGVSMAESAAIGAAKTGAATLGVATSGVVAKRAVIIAPNAVRNGSRLSWTTC
jgi:hypothetical protein